MTQPFSGQFPDCIMQANGFVVKPHIDKQFITDLHVCLPNISHYAGAARRAFCPSVFILFVIFFPVIELRLQVGLCRGFKSTKLLHANNSV